MQYIVFSEARGKGGLASLSSLSSLQSLGSVGPISPSNSKGLIPAKNLVCRLNQSTMTQDVALRDNITLEPCLKHQFGSNPLSTDTCPTR